MPVVDLVADNFGGYVDSRRKVGSQKETPELRVKGNLVSVGGYQEFTIQKGVVDKAPLSSKYLKLEHYLRDCGELLKGEGDFLDIGCSAGLLCFLAKEAGFRSVTGLDHDPEYIAILAAASQASGLKVEPIAGTWRDAPGTYDVVAGIAIIHWIYSVTASEGSFDEIFRYLATKTRRYLMLEWVAPEDGAIARFKHTSRNMEVQRESYTLENFLAAGARYFDGVDAVIDTSRTRHVYVFRKQAPVRNLRPRTSFSSMVRFNDTCIHKTFQPGAIAKHPGIVRREKQALSRLAGLPGFPLILASTETSVHVTLAGVPVSPANLPVDAEEQGRALVEAMRQKGLHHNDIHPGNLQVKDGVLHLIDFAWSSLGEESRDFLPDRIGVSQNVRQAGGPFDDHEMMRRSITNLRAQQAG